MYIITNPSIIHCCGLTPHLNNFQVLLAPLCRQARHAAELLGLRVGVVVHGGPGAADELARVQRARHSLDLQGFPEWAAVAGGIYYHGLGARVDLRLHHGDLQDVRHGRLLARGAAARLRNQFGGGLAAAEH